jgi:hypothetical protein
MRNTCILKKEFVHLPREITCILVKAFSKYPYRNLRKQFHNTYGVNKS